MKLWYVLHIFWISKILFRLLGLILDLLAWLIYPASENTLSDGTEVADVPNKALTALNKQGNSNLRSFHQLRRFNFYSILCPILLLHKMRLLLHFFLVDDLE